MHFENNTKPKKIEISKVIQMKAGNLGFGS